VDHYPANLRASRASRNPNGCCPPQPPLAHLFLGFPQVIFSNTLPLTTVSILISTLDHYPFNLRAQRGHSNPHGRCSPSHRWPTLPSDFFRIFPLVHCSHQLCSAHAVAAPPCQPWLPPPRISREIPTFLSRHDTSLGHIPDSLPNKQLANPTARKYQSQDLYLKCHICARPPLQQCMGRRT
jgi:hypothetical protein